METTVIKCDNKAAIAISHHPKYHAQTKHIDIALHFLCDYVQFGMIDIIHISSKDNLADLLMKGLSKLLHQHLTQQIGVILE